MTHAERYIDGVCPFPNEENTAKTLVLDRSYVNVQNVSDIP